MDRIPIGSGPWTGGINSLVDPLYLSDKNVQWSVNTLNRGGIYQTRPGYSILYDATNSGFPRGLTVFTPKSGDPFLVKAVGTKIRYSPYPFTTWFELAGVTLDNSFNPVFFETCIYGADSQFTGDGTVKRVDPFPVLFISTGNSKTIAWDGTIVRILNPEFNETPVGGPMKWVGNRLWIAQGPNLHASNLLEPSYFSEELDLSSGGFFTLPGDITGLGVTANFQSLLVFTKNTVTAFAATILDRNLWSSTPNFQQVILSDIGCIAPNSIINQYGMTWWYSEGGLVNLDSALSSYRTSRIHYQDEAMARSKANMSDDISNICTGGFGNFLMVSVPSGDLYPAHTWVMDEALMDTQDESYPPVWSSCWVGTKPLQWVTANIKGKTRVFFISYDIFPLQTVGKSNVWEAFCPHRYDFTVNTSGILVAKNIDCMVETKYLSNDASYKRFSWAGFMLSECENTFNITASYAPRHGGYKQVLNKTVVADVNSVIYNVEINNALTSRVRQTRFLRTIADEARLSDLDAGVEEPVTRNKDRGFFVKVNWSGPMALDQLTLFLEPLGDQPTGKVEPNETTDRYVNADGSSYILTTAAPAPSLYGGRQTAYVSPMRSRATEIRYNSLG